MKVRVLTDTIPAWLAPYLEGHQMVVGPLAWAEVWAELDGHNPMFVPPTKENAR